MKQRISKYSILNESKEDLLLVLSGFVSPSVSSWGQSTGGSQDSTGCLESRHSSLVESQGMKVFQKKN